MTDSDLTLTDEMMVTVTHETETNDKGRASDVLENNDAGAFD
ncbi:MAG: hypothetical protein U5M51_16810 [Emticicia sp.]|nr:hypothetical protein [Emticicia sp.]